MILVAVIGAAIVGRTSPSHQGAARAVNGSPSAPGAPGDGLPSPTVPPVCGAHLGVLGALSGPAAGFGTSVQQGVRLAIDRYNQRHAGCEVGLVDLDSAGNPAKAPALAAQAVADPHLLGLIGPLFSGESASALPVLDRAGLTAISPSATRTDLSAKGWRVFHRALANDAQQARAAGAYIRDTLAAKKVYVVDDGSAYGMEESGLVRAALGGAVVGTDRVRVGGSFAGTVGKLRASAADVVYFGGYYDGAGPLLGQMRKAGVQTTLVGGDGIDDPALFTLSDGQYVDGTVATCSACQVISDGDFLNAYGTAFNAEPTAYAAVAYDVANIFLSGLARGAGDRAAMLSYVNGYDGTGIAGRYRFARSGELTGDRATVGIIQIKAGQFMWVTSLPGR